MFYIVSTPAFNKSFNKLKKIYGTIKKYCIPIMSQIAPTIKIKHIQLSKYLSNQLIKIK